MGAETRYFRELLVSPLDLTFPGRGTTLKNTPGEEENSPAMGRSWPSFGAQRRRKPQVSPIGAVIAGEAIMSFIVQAEAPPLREDASGALRIGDSRVLLELVIRAFQDGATPETIVQRYSTLALADIYAVIGYYLRHRSEIEGYLARREEKAEDVRRRVEIQQGDLSEIRARLFTRRQAG